MVTDNHYRWDFIGLSTDTKPTPATSKKVVDGSTYYESDTSKLYVFCDTEWYERKPLGGGGGGTTYTAGDGIDITDDTISVDTTTIQEKLTAGTGIDITDNTISATGGGGPTVVQTTGTSTTDVMSQDATTKMIFPNENKRAIAIGDSANVTSPSTSQQVAIGYNAHTGGTQSVAIGYSAYAVENQRNCALGSSAYCNAEYGIALGANSNASIKGQMDISTGTLTTAGYNDTSYRLLTGVHDPVNAHDAATKGYVDAQAGGGVTTLTSADYNYKYGSGDPDGIALWLLDEGQYLISSGTNYYVDTSSQRYASMNSGVLVLAKPTGTANNERGMILYNSQNDLYFIKYIDNAGQNGQELVLPRVLVNNLTTTLTGRALDARQGKELKDLIDALDARVTALESN